MEQIIWEERIISMILRRQKEELYAEEGEKRRINKQ